MKTKKISQVKDVTFVLYWDGKYWTHSVDFKEIKRKMLALKRNYPMSDFRIVKESLIREIFVLSYSYDENYLRDA